MVTECFWCNANGDSGLKFCCSASDLCRVHCACEECTETEVDAAIGFLEPGAGLEREEP